MPVRSQQHVDQLLGNVSIKYQPQGLIAMEVFPEVPVKKDSDLYRTYTRNFRIPETKRANKALANEHQFEVGTATYALEYHALKDYVSDNDVENYDVTDLRTDTTEELTEKILLRLEKTVADLFTKTSWSLNVSLAAGATFADNTVTSNPIPVFDTATSTVLKESGFAPNYAIIPRDSFVAIKNHVSVLDRTKYTSKDMTAEMMKGLLGLENILVANGAYDTAAQGVTSNITSIWGDNCFVGYKPASAGPLKPSSGYVFRRNEPMVRRWRVEERQAEAIEVQMKYQAKVVASLSGYLICNTH
jgi:hypothetical protein